MSLTKLFSRRVLCLHLGSDSFAAVQRQGRQFDVASSHFQAVANPGQAWEVVLAELQSWLRHAPAGFQGLPLRISLASRWCQMQSLPWSDALLTPASAARFLQNQFVAAYGEAARDWIISSDDAPYGEPRMACAIERDLHDALQALGQELNPGAPSAASMGSGAGKHASLAGSGSRPPVAALQALEPVVAQAVRAMLARVGRREACAVIEPGRFSLFLLQKQRIVGVQTQACSGNWERELAASWMRWTLRQPELAQIRQVALLNLGVPATPAATLAAPFEAVLLPDFNLPANLASLSCDRGA